MTYKCPKCGMESPEKKDCEMCKIPMEEICPECGKISSDCACDEDVEEKK